LALGPEPVSENRSGGKNRDNDDRGNFLVVLLGEILKFLDGSQEFVLL
jgi:hypothetical protein